MEGRRNKKRKKDRKEEGIQGERRKAKKKKKVFCWLYMGQVSFAGFLSVKWEGVVGGIGFTFLPS